jgi:predicted transcriptional regulator
MGAIKQTIYNSEINEIATIGLALGHPARISILKILQQKGISNNKQLADYLLLHETTISQHIKFLLSGELIEGTYFGRFHHYKLSKKYTEQIEKLFREIEFL